MRIPAILAAMALALPLAGCYVANQGQLGNFVTSTIAPGMTLDEALVRMRAEQFDCQSSSAGTLTVCTRSQESLLRGTCIERVDLVRSAASVRVVGGIDILAITCSR
ncbi:hypothetical protein ASF61_09675 [Duganella sp. Leaf126]|uniref:hypothetical protein n=1 Tax=Duganella sp. Leaf126 TaxID=1736266 RepID=UPI0007003CD4|nr:hypothetical protein [Duganella sp. Leaf126]KQQ33348.1 hypothetical protein ASF61_09675 [Duganella sp. Leaf126]